MGHWYPGEMVILGLKLKVLSPCWDEEEICMLRVFMGAIYI